MALLPCYECNAEISTSATSCPRCGAPNKMLVKPTQAKEKPQTRPIFKLLAFAIAAFFIYLPFVKDNPAKLVDINNKPTVWIDSDKLAADYKANEVAADGTYKGQRINIAAVVDSINKDFKDTVWLGLRTNNQFMPIHAAGLEAAEVSKLKKGDIISMDCTGDGMVMGSPFLKDCGKLR